MHLFSTDAIVFSKKKIRIVGPDICSLICGMNTVKI